MTSIAPPTTPAKQIIGEDDIASDFLSPAAKETDRGLKRKLSQTFEEPARLAAGAYLTWSIRRTEIQIERHQNQLKDLRNSLELGLTPKKNELKSLIITLEDAKTEFEGQWVVMTKQKSFIREDIQDSMKSMENAFAEELYNHWREASSEGQQKAKKKPMSRKSFRKAVIAHLESERPRPDGAEYPRELFCQVLGYLPEASIKCAHIVPFSFASRELEYLFGVGDSALWSNRNGMMLNKVIEGAFDNGWVAIIPDGSVDSTPTEWKIVLLNNQKRENTVYTDPITHNTIRFKGIDGKRLRFCNENRPARRYLYFRYIMAYIHASKEKFPDLRTKLPPGRIWASPNKPDGYLRSSALQMLAIRIGDTPLPTDLVDAGAIKDAKTSSDQVIDDKTTALELAHRHKVHTNRDRQDDSQDDDDSGDEVTFEGFGVEE